MDGYIYGNDLSAKEKRQKKKKQHNYEREMKEQSQVHK